MAEPSDRMGCFVAKQPERSVLGNAAKHFFKELHKMAEGNIKRLTDKGFGFIETEDSGKDMFFHSSSLEGVSFDELHEGQRVSYTEGRGPKGPCAESVKLA